MEQEQHGTTELRGGDLPSQDCQLRSGGGTSLNSALREVSHTALDSLPPQAITLAVIILTVGAVAALLLFITLCFLKPDAANVLIPLMATPVVTVIVQHYLKKKVKAKDDE